MEVYRGFTKDVMWAGLINLAIFLRGLLVLPIISKAMGSVGYGIWIQITITVALIFPLTSLGLPVSITRFLPGEKNKKRLATGFYSSFFAALVASGIAALILFVFSSRISLFILNDAALGSLIKLTSVLIVAWCLQAIMLEYFKSTKQMSKYGLVYGTEMIVELLSTMLLVGYGIFYIVLGVLLIRIAYTLMSFGIVMKQLGWFSTSIKTLKGYLRFGLPIVPTEFFMWLISSSDRYIIALFLTTSLVGIYSASYSLAGMIAYLGAPITLMLLPTMSRAAKNHNEYEIVNYIKYSTKYFLFMAMPLAAILSILSYPILKLMTTVEFVGYGSILIPIISIAMIFSGLRGIFGQLILLSKNTKRYMLISAAAAISAVALNLLLVPLLGIVGSAIATLVTFFVFLTATMMCTRFDLSSIYKDLLKAVFATAVIAMILMIAAPTRISHMLIAVVAVIPVYITILSTLKAFDKKELAFLKYLLDVRSR